MEWINLHISQLRKPEFIGSEPVARATWLYVAAYCVEQENGGRIVNGLRWKDRQWQQSCGVTLEEVQSADGLLLFDGDDVIVFAYPLDKELEVRSKREAGRIGGQNGKGISRNAGNQNAAKQKQNAAKQKQNKSTKQKQNKTEGKGKGNRKEGEGEGNSAVAPATTLPQTGILNTLKALGVPVQMLSSQADEYQAQLESWNDPDLLQQAIDQLGQTKPWPEKLAQKCDDIAATTAKQQAASQEARENAVMAERVIARYESLAAAFPQGLGIAPRYIRSVNELKAGRHLRPEIIELNKELSELEESLETENKAAL